MAIKIQTIIQKMDQLAQHNILVIGDIMLDEYHWCDVSRISPEAPIPICEVKKTTLVPGGAANVANNINALNNTTFLYGTVGNDSSGDKLIETLKDLKVTTKYIQKTKTKPTILKSRIIANQQHLVRVDREVRGPISKTTESKLLTSIESVLKKTNAVLISDYLKGTLTPSLTKKIIQLCNKHKIPTLIDPKGLNYTKYKGAFLIKPNFKEFKEITKSECKTESQIKRAANKLIKHLNIKNLIVTRSEKGMSIFQDNGKQIDLPIISKEVYDITGAGDTVLSTLSIALASGWELDEAAYLANCAAGIVIGKIGTATTTLDEISTKLHHLQKNGI